MGCLGFKVWECFVEKPDPEKSRNFEQGGVVYGQVTGNDDRVQVSEMRPSCLSCEDKITPPQVLLEAFVDAYIRHKYKGCKNAEPTCWQSSEAA